MGGRCAARVVGMLCALLLMLPAAAVWAEPGNGFAQMAQQVREQAAVAGATVSVVVRDLQRGDAVYERKDVIMPAASIIKVPIMVAVFSGIDRGELTLTDTLVLREQDKADGSGILRYCTTGSVWSVYELLRLMIDKSDNTATDMLIARLGQERINARMRELGLTATRVRRRILDYDAIGRGVENTTTAYEISRLLELIYRGQAAAPDSCRRMMDILLLQEYNDRIPRFLFDGVWVVHKTGMMDNL
ncbi:MAG TPA: class A beta-lactamase-related serine hydrolase, partial [bacterium]|nr:class A beta-lactamase-related serine hydrolase [bacterium]